MSKEHSILNSSHPSAFLYASIVLFLALLCSTTGEVGYYLELVQVDKIYATRQNRQLLKEREIRITASPLGRRKEKCTEIYYQKRKCRKEAAERNDIEGKFGQGKNGYRLNEIRARLKDTSESWIACLFFIMNLIHYEKKIIFGLIFRGLINVQMRVFFQMRILIERFMGSPTDLETGNIKLKTC